MSFDPYVLERITASRLTELRAEAARHRVLASARAGRTGVWDVIKGALLRAGRLFGRRGTVRPRHA
jgi:hypothetical protein